MYKLGLYDFGHWTHRVRDALEAHGLNKQVSLRIRRTMFVAGRDKSVYLDVDMELHKARDGRLGPERITGCTVDVGR